MEIRRIVPEHSQLPELASTGSAPEWIADELRPYTHEDLLRDLDELAKLEEGE